jgi:hypothetical protein
VCVCVCVRECGLSTSRPLTRAGITCNSGDDSFLLGLYEIDHGTMMGDGGQISECIVLLLRY